MREFFKAHPVVTTSVMISQFATMGSTACVLFNWIGAAKILAWIFAASGFLVASYILRLVQAQLPTTH